MKKTVLIFGLISGSISAAWIIFSFVGKTTIDFSGGMVMGFTIMFLASLLIFFGIRSYRENHLGGYITFGKALQVGTLIALIAAGMYVLTWEIIYFGGMAGDFIERYTAYEITQMQKAGATQAAIDAKIAENKIMVEKYHMPLYNIGVTFMENFPVGFLFALISAAILRKQPKQATA